MKKLYKHYFIYVFAFMTAALSTGSYWGGTKSDDYGFEVKFYVVNEVTHTAAVNFVKRSRISLYRAKPIPHNVQEKDSTAYLLSMRNFEELELISYNGTDLKTEVINSSNVFRIHYFPPNRDEIIERLISDLRSNKIVDPGIILAGKIVAYEMVDTDSSRPFK